MMHKTIDDLLLEIKEDKTDNLTTTSFKFKRDLWDFFQGFEDRNCVEFGTHKGQTTRVLAHLFKRVYTFNLPGHFDAAEELNRDLDNIIYYPIDLYQTAVDDNLKHHAVSLFFIDAGHDFNQVLSDFTRCMNMKHAKGDVFFVFDDYGQESRNIYMCVEQLIRNGRLERVKYIGHPTGHSFGGNPERILQDWEGIICKLKSV